MFIDVTAAVIIYDEKILLTTRPEGKHLAGFWEFPGGKLSEGETMEECIQREIKEELGVEIIPLDTLFCIEHHYTEKSVRITFFRALPENKENFNPFPKEKQKIGFFTFEELKNLDIVPADKPLIKYLMHWISKDCQMLDSRIKELRNLIKDGLFLRQDEIRIEHWLKKISKITDEKHLAHQLEKLDKVLITLKNKKQKHLYKPEIKYPEELPITAKVNEIKKLIEHHQVIIVSGATGSGKTTQLPKILLDMGFAENGVIGCTQPRRIAATGMARRVAAETKCSYGKEIGCQIRFERNVSDDTLVKFMTDGILLSETVKDKNLLQYSALIIDEVHERSLNIDFILGYLKRLTKKRKDLKIIISSATLDSGGFSKFFNDAPIVEVEGKTFPIEDIFLPPYEDEDLSQHCCRAVEWITDIDPYGDILIFMPGEREIRDAADLLSGRQFKNTQILALYGRISIAEQNRIFEKESRRRIIVSTNVAETSITIPGIHYVVDSGFARINRYNPKTQIQMLQIEQISKASAKQRRGRCGRISEGVCVYLYDRDVMEAAPDYTDPEICRTSLSGVILQMKILNLPDIEDFPFLDMPSVSLVREGKKGLREIQALNKDNELTEEGRNIGKFPIEPRFAKMVCEAKRQKVLPEVLAVVSYLSLQDPRERPELKKMAADQAHAKWKNKESDFITVLNLWNYLTEEIKTGASNTKLRNICKKDFLNYKRIKEWFNLYQDLDSIVEDEKWQQNINIEPFHDFSYDFIHMSILAGFPMNIGQKKEGNVYNSTGNRKFYIFPGSGVFKTAPEWVMAFPLVETTRLFGRSVAKINTEWLEKIAPHLCRKKYYDIHWDAEKGFVFALESITFSGMEVKAGRKVHYGSIDSKASRKIFISCGMVPGEMHLKNHWLKKHRELIDKIKLLEIKKRMPDALLNKDAVFEYFDRTVPEDVLSAKTLDRWLFRGKNKINMRLTDAVYPQLSEINENDYPDFIEINKEKFELKYNYCPGEKEDGTTLYVSEEKLLFIPEYLPDWIIPGWLPDKVERLVKSLPKDIKTSLFPLKQLISDFMERVSRNNIFKNQFLIISIIEFIREKYDINCSVEDFDLKTVPEFLTLNIAVTDDKTGKIKSLSRGLADVDREKLSDFYSSVVGIEKWTRSGLKSWPDFEIPESIILNKETQMKGFPALVDEGETVGVKVFLNEDEAMFFQKSGLTALFRIEFVEQYKFLEKKVAITRNTALSLSSIYSSSDFKKEILDAAVGSLMTERNYRFVRTEKEFEKQCENVLGSLYRETEKNCAALTKIFTEKDELFPLLLKNSGVYSEIIQDIKNQIDILLSPGFLKLEMTYSRFFRYLQALKIRLQRLSFNKEKDYARFMEIKKYQSALEESISGNKNIYSSYTIVEALILLQEYRIKVFAPELKPFENINLKDLEDKFKKLFLSLK